MVSPRKLRSFIQKYSKITMYSNLIVYYKFRNFLLEVSKQNFQKKVSIYRQFGCKTALGEAKIKLEHDTVTWQMNHSVEMQNLIPVCRKVTRLSYAGIGKFKLVWSRDIFRWHTRACKAIQWKNGLPHAVKERMLYASSKNNKSTFKRHIN